MPSADEDDDDDNDKNDDDDDDDDADADDDVNAGIMVIGWTGLVSWCKRGSIDQEVTNTPKLWLPKASWKKKKGNMMIIR